MGLAGVLNDPDLTVYALQRVADNQFFQQIEERPGDLNLLSASDDYAVVTCVTTSGAHRVHRRGERRHRAQAQRGDPLRLPVLTPRAWASTSCPGFTASAADTAWAGRRVLHRRLRGGFPARTPRTSRHASPIVSTTPSPDPHLLTLRLHRPVLAHPRRRLAQTGRESLASARRQSLVAHRQTAHRYRSGSGPRRLGRSTARVHAGEHRIADQQHLLRVLSSNRSLD